MRRPWIAGVVVVFSLCSATAVMAGWLATSDPGPSSATAAALPAGNKPVASVSPPSSLEVSVSWAPSTGGAPVEGYEVHAYAAPGGALRPVGGSCTGLVTGTTCTDTAVPNGTWRYTVVPRQQAWYGAESPLSTSVTVDPGYRSYVMADGPAAYWRLGESSGTTAVDEMGGSDGSYGTGFTLGQSGAMAGDANTATSLSGGRISIPAAAAAVDLTGHLSVEAWIRPNAGQVSNTRVVGRFNGSVVQYLLAYDSTGKLMRFVIDVGSGRLTAVSSAELRDGLWHHIVGTWDGSAARLYVDGVVQATRSGSGPVQVAANMTNFIGGDHTATPNFYSGVVDEVAVYGNALSPAQILTHHQQGSLNRPTAAVAFPDANGRYNTTIWNAGCSNRICGSAADPDGSVASVSISVRQNSTGLFFDGTSFASASRVLVPGTGTTSWTSAFPGSNFPSDDVYIVTVVAVDDAGNDGGVTRSFTIDRTPPIASVTFPAASGTYNDASWAAGCVSRICGSTSDGGGVASVTVSIRRGTGDYWNGTAFASATEVLLPVTGTTSWTLNFSAANLSIDGAYTVRVVATDVVGNTGSTSRSFTIDRVAPTVVVGFPAAGGSYTSSSWDAGCTAQVCGTAADAGVITSVAVSVRQGAGNYWNGTAFASATEVLLPVTGTTSWTLDFPAANLPADGAYTVRAVTTDAAGNTGTASSTATLDITAPAPTAISLVDADGLITPTTDEVAITFSESLSASSLCSTWSGSGDQAVGGSGTVVTVTDNGADDVLTVTTSGCTLNVGSLATGGDYVSATSTFAGSTTGTESRITWTAATRVLTIRLGDHTSGSLSAAPQSAGTITYTSHASITDRAGNPVATTPLGITDRRF